MAIKACNGEDSDIPLIAEVFTQENLTSAFEGVLRRYVLSATELHNDDDQREVVVLSDDERPVVIYGGDDKSD